MYYYKYSYAESSNSENVKNGNYKSDTVLEAKFLFGDEVAPCDREKVRQRINTSEEGLVGLNGFLISRAYHSEEDWGERRYIKGRETLKISPCTFSLGFRLKSEAKGNYPLEDMIDLDALNDFVLHGMPKTNLDLEPTPSSMTDV